MKQQHVNYQVAPYPKSRRFMAARFTQRLKELIESGYGLFDSTIAGSQPVEAGSQQRDQPPRSTE